MLRLDGYFPSVIIRFDAQGNTFLGNGDKLYRINASDKINTIEGDFMQTDKIVVSNRGDVVMLDRNTLKNIKDWLEEI